MQKSLALLLTVASTIFILFLSLFSLSPFSLLNAANSNATDSRLAPANFHVDAMNSHVTV